MMNSIITIRSLSQKLICQLEPKNLSQNILYQSCCINFFQSRNKSTTLKRRSKRPKPWWVPKHIKYFDDKVAPSSKKFFEELEEEQYSNKSPLKQEPLEREAWTTESRRTGVIARKIGIYPQWMKNGQRVLTTLLQVLDNHVIRHHSSADYAKMESGKKYNGKYGALVVGANAGSPQLFTKAYCGLFDEAGVLPKKKLTRFLITDDAKIQPGTPLSAAHFKAGDFIDVHGITIDHGFQGVVKRWGMKGGPASHGHNKNHRRIGSVGGGTGRAHIIKGKHMPGHMGNERRTLSCLKILRINHKYNVIWVKGGAVPGHVHQYVHITDTCALKYKLKRNPENVPFPTHYLEDEELDEEVCSDDLFVMDDPSIEYAIEEKKKSAKSR